MKIENAVILVTGAGHGLGRGMVERLANNGALVAFTYRNDADGAHDLEQTLAATGQKAKAYKVLELADDQQTAQLFQSVVADFGKIDAVIANASSAGINKDEDLFNLDIDAWQATLKDSLIVAVTTTKHAIEALNANDSGGKILLIGSVLGLDYMGNPKITAYSAAKAATHNFGRAVAKNLAPKIIVNVLAPGRCWANAYQGQSEDYIKAKFAVNRHERPIEADEIAHAAQMILENDSIIGQVISVDAGFSLRDV